MPACNTTESNRKPVRSIPAAAAAESVCSVKEADHDDLQQAHTCS
jgi:hypothetical protein